MTFGRSSYILGAGPAPLPPQFLVASGWLQYLFN